MKTKQKKPTMCQCVSNCAITKNGITLCGYCLKEKPTTAGKEYHWECPVKDCGYGFALYGEENYFDEITKHKKDHIPPETGKEWEAEIRETIEMWKYQAGDDVLASALADEIIQEVKSLLLSEHRRWEAELRKKVEKPLRLHRVSQRMEMMPYIRSIFDKGAFWMRDYVLSILEEGKGETP